MSSTLKSSARSTVPALGWPDTIQAVLLMRNRPQVMRWMQRKHGDVFGVRMPYGPHGSMVSVVVTVDPDHIREIFAGSPAIFHAGEGNASLLDVMGEHSLLLVDEAEHARAKKLLLPAFSGGALESYRPLVRAIASRELDRWRDGEVFAATERMQSITLSVIIQVVFGVTDPRRIDALRPLVSRIANIDLGVALGWKYPRLQRVPPWRSYLRAQRELDRLIYAEITERRADPGTLDRDDLLSRLLRPAPDGDTLTDAELRDQLVTFLLAGHETTATSLSWALHELAHRPEVLRRAQQAASHSPAGDAYLDAVAKEALRLRPVIFNVTRTLTEPITLGGYRLDAGVVVSPGIGLMGLDERRHIDALEFRPERFLDGHPAVNTWIPFGGGARRCIGAGFSLMESVEILREVLSRFDVEPARRRPERLRPRVIINAPEHGGVIRCTAR